MWEKFKASFKNSVTILWARLVAVSGVLLGALLSLSNDPTINSSIQQLLQPKYLPLWIIAFGVVTEIARRRTAGKDS